eukprot:TRINITY_DN70854_c0_g1_i1.p1 TRINITY_DN70854_c0_g1~~TRINITY_DN70854_c0_g1_i1.p1  ORF type:complete len:377 (+),score=112.06 TRINITY_DN70854_c0_g1_i1:75-1133(+)
MRAAALLVFAAVAAEGRLWDCANLNASAGSAAGPPHRVWPECRAAGPWIPPSLEARERGLLHFDAQRSRLGLNVTRSRCTVTAQRAECAVQKATVGGRPVFYQVPDGEPPAAGWPVMLYFHAWYSGGKGDWAADYPTAPNVDGGVYWEVQTKKALLDMGVAWVSPDATRNGSPCPGNRNCWWETNEAPYNTPEPDIWERSGDAKFLAILFESMEKGDLGGQMDLSNMHTGGYSSGGFMVSRTAFNYPGRFRSHFNLAASLYYCCGCGLDTCPEEWLERPLLAARMQAHPPTLFLHGAADRCVTPLESAMYRRRLDAVGVPTKYVSPEGVRHHWLPDSHVEVAAWIGRYGRRA